MRVGQDDPGQGELLHTVGAEFGTDRVRTELVVQRGDVITIAASLTVTGPGVGAVISYGVVAALLLQVSVVLAVVVLLGVPRCRSSRPRLPRCAC
ncbi:hypothetical protein AB0L53_34055 [Nonomuraea sp. NPDC052129]|uniref:hypothetical protein n=1 Tax=Nonomuraea sp. NPDC052129 TaxID=3154651 RepID=UPI00343A8D9B